MTADRSNTAVSASGPVPEAARSVAADRFREFLRESGLKLTHEREEILQQFFRVGTHVEAEQMLAIMREAGSRVSRATIYRTLDLLVQSGMARRVRLGTDHYHYEHVLGRRQHEHMICLGCEKVIEWYDPELEGLLRRNLEQQGFTAARSSVQIFGYCRDCSAD